MLISSIIIAVSIVIFVYAKYNYNKLNNEIYVLTSKHDINTLNSINNNEFYSIEYSAATGLAFNLVDLGKQNRLKGLINFSYMCNYQNINYKKIIKKGLSSKNRSLYPNKNENNE